MSYNYDDEMVWVGDIDGHINISAIGREYEQEKAEAALDAELDTIGEIALLNGKVISSYAINERGISPSEWRWANFQAEQALCNTLSNSALEHGLVRALLSLGRPYAIARYAKIESVAHPSALAASLPLGFQALLHQFFIGQGIQSVPRIGNRIRSVLRKLTSLTDENAYGRTSMVQSLIHEIAEEADGYGGAISLDRKATRTMLSLARLHFSVAEINLISFSQLAELSDLYAKAREAEKIREPEDQSMNTRYIHNWRLRHLRPLTEYFPFSIRNSFMRGADHTNLDKELSREIAINELALSHCGLLLMRNRMYSSVAKRMLNEISG